MSAELNVEGPDLMTSDLMIFSKPTQNVLKNSKSSDAQTGSIISLSSDHGSSSKINIALRRTIMHSGSDESLTDICKNDMKVYKDLLSLRTVPEYCPCKYCMGTLLSLRHGLRANDGYGFRRVTGLSLILSMKDQIEVQNGPMFPEMRSMVSRMESLNEEFGFSEMKKIADAGFFCTGIGKRRKTCFYCDLCLCDEMLLHNPMREHARWCPVCPYVRLKMSDQYVHCVIEDSRSLKRYYRGHNRPIKMDSDIVEDALNDYTPIIIQESIRFFFEENGSFPTREELFYILETKKEWKTFTALPLM